MVYCAGKRKENCSLRSKRFCAVLGAKNEEQESKTARKMASPSPVSFFGSRLIARPIKTENLFLLRNRTETLATRPRKLKHFQFYLKLKLVNLSPLARDLQGARSSA